MVAVTGSESGRRADDGAHRTTASWCRGREAQCTVYLRVLYKRDPRHDVDAMWVSRVVYSAVQCSAV